MNFQTVFLLLTFASVAVRSSVLDLSTFESELPLDETPDLKPAAFSPGQEDLSNPLMCFDEIPFMVGEKGKIFVDELPSTKIEGAIRGITNEFVDTLKTNKSWFIKILFNIRKEQKRRESVRCKEGECMYKIPCYLSQHFLTMTDYEKRLNRARVAKGFDSLRRRRRSLDGLPSEETDYDSLMQDGKAPVTNCTGVFANYCYNSISCIYVSVLESAACS